METDREIFSGGDASCPLVLADTRAVFFVRGVSGEMKFVLYRPMSAIECHQIMFRSMVFTPTGDATYDFF